MKKRYTVHQHHPAHVALSQYPGCIIATRQHADGGVPESYTVQGDGQMPRSGSLIAYKKSIAGYILLMFFLPLFFAGAANCASGSLPENTEQQNSQLLQEGNGFFRQAGVAPDAEQARILYNKALLRFEGLVKNGVRNGKLFYNIGNTYFRLDDLGRALVNYRRAEHFMANDDNLRQNITYILSRQPDNIVLQQDEQIVKTLFFWHYDLSYGTRLICLVAFNALLWGFLAIRLLWRPGSLGMIISLSLVACVLLAGSLLIESKGGGRRTGVLVSPEVTARKGDGMSYKASFEGPLHAGLDFTLVEKRGAWLHIALRDGSKCWIPAGSAEMVF